MCRASGRLVSARGSPSRRQKTTAPPAVGSLSICRPVSTIPFHCYNCGITMITNTSDVAVHADEPVAQVAGDDEVHEGILEGLPRRQLRAVDAEPAHLPGGLPALTERRRTVEKSVGEEGIEKAQVVGLQLFERDLGVDIETLWVPRLLSPPPDSPLLARQLVRILAIEDAYVHGFVPNVIPSIKPTGLPDVHIEGRL